MLELITALVMQEVESFTETQSEPSPVIEAYLGLEAECLWTGEFVEGELENFGIICPKQAPYHENLDRRAQWVVEQIDVQLTRRSSFLASPLILMWNGDDWVLPKPLLIEESLTLSILAPALARRSTICAGQVNLRRGRSPQTRNWRCRSARVGGRVAYTNRAFQDLILDGIEDRQYLLPEGVNEYCISDSLVYLVEESATYDELNTVFPLEDQPRCPS